MSNWPDVLQRERLELVLLEEVIQVLLQHLEHKTRVVLVGEALVGANKVVFVRIFLAEISHEISEKKRLDCKCFKFQVVPLFRFAIVWLPVAVDSAAAAGPYFAKFALVSTILQETCRRIAQDLSNFTSRPIRELHLVFRPIKS